MTEVDMDRAIWPNLCSSTNSRPKQGTQDHLQVASKHHQRGESTSFLLVTKMVIFYESTIHHKNRAVQSQYKTPLSHHRAVSQHTLQFFHLMKLPGFTFFFFQDRKDNILLGDFFVLSLQFSPLTDIKIDLLLDGYKILLESMNI